jgi:hypothetical protein
MRKRGHSVSMPLCRHEDRIQSLRICQWEWGLKEAFSGLEIKQTHQIDWR